MMEVLLNRVEPGQRIIMFMVPTRVFRIIQTDETAHTFRVEQLVQHTPPGHPSPMGEWKSVTTHGNPIEAWTALMGAAVPAACEAQQNFIHKLKQRMHKREQADRQRIIRP